MFTIIHNHRYDAETDQCLGAWSNGLKPGDFAYYAESLYRTRTGLYFLYRRGGPDSPCSRAWCSAGECCGRMIDPVTQEQARAWAKKHLSAAQTV